MNPYHQPTPPYKKRKKWSDTVHHIVNNTGIHKHSFTCHKGCTRKKQCREAYMQRPVPQSRPVFLTPHSNSTYKALSKPLDEYPPMSSTVIPPKKRPCTRDIRKEPIPAPDLDRNLYWEIKRATLHVLEDYSATKSLNKTPVSYTHLTLPTKA